MQEESVWVPLNGYSLCRVVSRDSKSVTVELENGDSRDFPVSDVIVHTGEDYTTIEDLIQLNTLNEAVILNSLVARYMKGDIYVCWSLFFLNG